MFINDEAQKQVLPIIARTTVSPTTEAQQRAGALLQLNPGQQVKAEIIANLPNSLYLARIAGEMYQLEIPLNVQPGETMDLTFVAAEPRVTFQVLMQPQGSASVKLSPVGKWLAAVVQDASPMALAQEPLAESPLQSTALLASRLKEALTQSGLFYESHLAQWAAGGLQLSEILKEPQGKLSRVASAEHKAGAADDAPDAGYADVRALPIIKEQLLLLHSGILSWKGEVWPGQGMEVSVTERGTEEGEPAVEATVNLDLPRLGGVEAKVRFGAEGITVEMVCDKEGSSAVLRKGTDQLRTAMASAGLHLSHVAAKDGEEEN